MEKIIGDCQLILGDCLEILPAVERVDACVFDPPYELSDSGPGQSHYGMSLKKFDSKEYRDIVNGFDISIFELLEKICVPFNMFCFCSNKQISKIMNYHEKLGRIVTLIVWHKTNAAPFANGVWRGDIEYCIHARDNGSVFLGNAREKKKVANYPIVQNAQHPAEKPLGIMKKYIKICSEPNQIILDPFMGSGTTGVACAKMRRKFIGIEKEREYFDIACERIERAYAEPDLFRAHDPMHQETLI